MDTYFHLFFKIYINTLQVIEDIPRKTQSKNTVYCRHEMIDWRMQFSSEEALCDLEMGDNSEGLELGKKLQ